VCGRRVARVEPMTGAAAGPSAGSVAACPAGVATGVLSSFQLQRCPLPRCAAAVAPLGHLGGVGVAPAGCPYFVA
jgi:hypothetical protein